MNKGFLPWLFPLGVLLAVIVGAVANNLIVAGIILMLLGWAVIPLAVVQYRKTRKQVNEDRTHEL